MARLWSTSKFWILECNKAADLTSFRRVAPRPHNSGHYTIEAVPQLSQYKAQICALLNTVPEELTLAPRVPSALMVNILGGAKPDSHDKLVELTQSMGNSSMDVYLHQYGKESKPGRKIGHITATGFSSISKLAEQAQPLIDAAAEMRAERVGEKFSAQSQGKSKGTPLVAMTMVCHLLKIVPNS